jgi:hypothetical protein
VTTQVVLIIVGALLFAVAIAGSGDYVIFKVPLLGSWARIILGIAGCGIFALSFTPLNNAGIQPKAFSSMPPSAPASPTNAASPVASPTNALSSVQTPYAVLQSPGNGALVSRSQGFIASGKAASLGPNTIWILDYDGGYTVDQEAVVYSETWTAVDRPLGDSSDRLPFSLTMRAVVANPHCAEILSQINSTSDDYIQNLPDGCKIIGQVAVKVSSS